MSTFKNNVLPAIFTQNYKEVSKAEQDLMRALTEVFSSIESILNRGIKFQDNVDCRLATFTSSGTPDAENTVAHGLGKIPVGYIVYSRNKASVLYDGTTANTAINLYVKANVATTIFKIIVF